MKVLVCGSRSWQDHAPIRDRINQLPSDTIVIHGGAHGADRLAGSYARRRGLHVAVVPANFDYYGRQGGPMRNRAMLELEPDYVIAFRDGYTLGTSDMIHAAQEKGIEVEVIER